MVSIVSIIGVGFVGDALQYSFSQLGIETILYDKYKNIGSFDSCLEAEIIFLCLPTPYSDELGCYDKTSIRDVCAQLREVKYTGIIVVKSTVEPGTCRKLSQEGDWKLRIVHNPEFLTARTAREDFHKQQHIVLGDAETVSVNNALFIQDFYQKYYPIAEISICSSWESEAMKLFVNSFYAMKVQIFNEFYLLCEKSDASYNGIRSLMLKNGWINPMHTMVPGPDGKLSYGGGCFPKDTKALLACMEKIESPAAVLKACIKERDAIRSKDDASTL